MRAISPTMTMSSAGMIVRLASRNGAVVHHGEDGFDVLIADRIDVQERGDALKAERHEHEQHGSRRQ